MTLTSVCTHSLATGNTHSEYTWSSHPHRSDTQAGQTNKHNGITKKEEIHKKHTITNANPVKADQQVAGIKRWRYLPQPEQQVTPPVAQNTLECTSQPWNFFSSILLRKTRSVSERIAQNASNKSPSQTFRYFSQSNCAMTSIRNSANVTTPISATKNTSSTNQLSPISMKPISTKQNKTSANKKSATNQPAMASQTIYQHNAHLPTLLVMNRGESPNFGAALGEFMFVSSNKMLDHQSSASYLFTDHRPQRTRLKSWTSNDISGDESLLLFPATGHESKSSPRFGPMLSSSPIWGASSLLTSGMPDVTLGEERTRNRNENSSQGRSPRAQVVQYRSGNERPISTSLVSPSGFSGDPDAFFMGNSRSIGDRSLPFGTSPIIRDMHNTSELTDIVLISDDVVPGYEFMSGNSPRTQVLLEDSSDRNLNLGPSLTPSSSPQTYVVVSVPSVKASQVRGLRDLYML